MNEYIERGALRRAITCQKVMAMERSDLTEQMIGGKNPDAWLRGFDCGMQQALDIIAATNDPKVVVEIDKFASKIAGHSYYRGDKILVRLYCLKEGQKIEESIEPADVVEVVHGKWIDPEDDDGGTTWHCSKCGIPAKTTWGIPYGNYCPNCGAKMDGKG